MSSRKISNRTIDKYKLIVDEWFVNGFNGTKAYQKFYPRSKASTADKRFRDLTEIDRIHNYISQKKEHAEKLLRSKHEGILNEIENWAYSDITEVIGLNSDEIKSLPSDVRRLISKYKHTQRSIMDDKGNVAEVIDRFDVSFVPKDKAMDMLNRHTGFYEKDNRQRVSSEETTSREERDGFINKLVLKHLVHKLRKLDKAVQDKKYTFNEMFDLLGLHNINDKT